MNKKIKFFNKKEINHIQKKYKITWKNDKLRDINNYNLPNYLENIKLSHEMAFNYKKIYLF